MPLRNAQLDEHRSRIGMGMPDVGDTKLYQKVVGGIKIGYSGHVPRAQMHAFTPSLAACRGERLQLHRPARHVAWQEKSVGRGEKMAFATRSAQHSRLSRPSTRCRGGRRHFLRHNDPSAAARARPSVSRQRRGVRPSVWTRAQTMRRRRRAAAAAAAHAAGCRMAWASTSAGLPPQPVAQEMPTQDLSARRIRQQLIAVGAMQSSRTMPAAPQPTHAAGSPTRKAWPALLLLLRPSRKPPSRITPLERHAPTSARRLASGGARLAGNRSRATAPPPLQQNEMFRRRGMRDPDEVALKPRMVKRIVSGLHGKAE